MLEVWAELGGRPVDLADQERVAGRRRAARASGAAMPGGQWLEWRRSSAATSGGSGNGNGSARGGVVEQVGVLRQAVDGVERGTRRRPGRARTGRRPASPRRPPGFRQSRSGCSGKNECRYQRPVAASRVHAGPPNAARQLLGRGVGPDVAVGVLAKPGVLDRRVARDEVEQERDAAGVGRVGERPHVGDRSEARVDGREVGDVVAAVGERRRVERREPDRVDAEVGEVIDPRERSRAGRRCRRRRNPGTSAGRSGTPPRSPSPVQKRGQTPILHGFGPSRARSQTRRR